MNYNNITLVPKYGVLSSRSEANTRIVLGNRTFKLPIVPSNMRTVVNRVIAQNLATSGYFYIYHRFPLAERSLPDFIINFCRYMTDYVGTYTSISLGVKEDSVQTVHELIKHNIVPNYITLDIAHAHSVVGMKMLYWLRNKFPDSFIIAGNVATPEAVMDLETWGADTVKLGIAQGEVCTTYNKTGFGRGMVETILECSAVARKPLIADGGIREHGDIAKALVLGADMVMIGSLLAAHVESPGDMKLINNKWHVGYYGSASAENKGEHRNVEGKEIYIPLRGSIMDTYREMKEDLQSSISYAGGSDLSAFNNVQWETIR